MSDLAQSSVFADRAENVSPDGLEGWFNGNIVTDFCHEISCQIANLIVANIDGKPPKGQERACSTVNDFPHVQVEERLDGS